MELSKTNGEVKHVTEVPGQIHEFRPVETKGADDDCVYTEVPQPPPDPRDAYIAKCDRKLQLMRRELEQYRNDLTFWVKAHGSEYPGRRLVELDKKMQEIEQA